VSHKKPTNLKIIEGTFRPDRHLKNEVVYSEAEDNVEGLYPQSLTSHEDALFVEDATNQWSLFCRELRAQNLLHTTDMHELELLCYWIAISRLCMRNMKNPIQTYTNKANKKNEIISAHIKVLKEATEQVTKLSAKFGFSPSDKTKIAVPEKPKQSKFDSL